ncbi:DUF4097 family beta strand repeat-containing protein [Streptomyces sp. NPDC048483]|uniref:DUF4097 family beta strand repeat-containing protein n=1 Tax=Streptomyces sp. NPDC048483 TaxID=3154927 RepID=UPI0034286BD7
MPNFDTPDPISVTLEFDIGSARIIAGKRTDTVVEVLPSNDADDADVRAAEQTKVTFTGGKLLVKGLKRRSLFGKSGSVEVTVELPTDSDVLGVSPMADLICEGRFGECRLKTSLGTIRVDEAGAVNLRTGHGAISVDRVTGDAEITGAGQIDIGEIAGNAVVKNLNGESVIGEIGGGLKVNASNGHISVDVAHASVEAKCANGSIRIGEVECGKVTLQAAAGDIEVGVREPTAAWLDVHTRVGKVRNSIEPSEGPGDSGSTVEVHARTGVGNIVIRRP